MGEICLNCGSENIVKEVQFGSAGDGAYLVGPKYRSGAFFKMMSKTEPTWCDICMDCGEITRIFIKETGREWWTKKEIDEHKIF